MKTTRRYYNKYSIAILMIASFIFLPTNPQGSANSAKVTIYFYNPESNIDNFVSLKIEFDTYLSGFGDYQFQPFDNRGIFEKTVGKNPEGILLLSSWHYNLLTEKTPLRPLLVGVANGKTTFRKILSAKGNFRDIDSLKGKNVASSGNLEYTKSLLFEIFGEEKEEIINSLKIMPAPKDIDALMAVGFGMASAALTTENSLHKLKKINLKQYKSLNQIGLSGEKLLPVVACLGNFAEDLDEIVDVMLKMGDHPQGRKKLRMLGLSGWKKINESEAMGLRATLNSGI